MNFTFQHIETVDSTNAYLQRLQGTTEINGFVVSADEQTSGRGMGNNSWESAKGMNLTFSLALDTSWLTAANQFMLSQIVPLGILNVLDSYLPAEKLQIKWPNDIYFDGHKLGGILINSTITGNHLDRSIIGIGLNVNQTQFRDWPTRPISMQLITGKTYTMEPLMKKLVTSIVDLIEREHQRASVDEHYYARLFRYHTWADYEANGKQLRLFMTGIDSFGRLQLIDETQHPYCFDIKELRFLI